jgi:NAD(P)-dependent dehydrogenase (short-subunit alcohol dehydrogenase family)
MLQLDVTDPASQCALATRTKGSHADLQCGRRSGQKLESGYPSAMWEAAFAANVTSVFMTIQSMLSNLRLSKAPKIAIISS